MLMDSVGRDAVLGSRGRMALNALLLGLVALTFFSAIADPDFFWHLATGRWIAENLALPERDPFTPFYYQTEREALILKGYWLAQLSYHLLYQTLGFSGIILLKTAVFVGIFALVLAWHQREGSPYHWLVLALLPLYEALIAFRADRPNLFSILFFAALLYLLETRRWWLLPLLMLLWANTHAGYLLGNLVVVLYLGMLWLGRSEDFSLKTVGWGLGAIGASMLNPLGVKPLGFMWAFQGSAYQQNTVEFMSPVQLALLVRDYHLGYFLALGLAVAALVFCRKKEHWPHFAILLLTAYISLRHARYMPFLVIACAFFLPRVFRRVTLRPLWGQCLFWGSLALIGFFFLVALGDGRTLKTGLDPDRYPQGAARFIADTEVAGNIFCTDVWGGYLIWRLPHNTILNDTRGLSDEAYLQVNEITHATGNWEQELRARDASILVISAFNPISGFLGKLWQRLNYASDWQLVYADEVALVYFREAAGDTARRIVPLDKLSASLEHALRQIRTIVAKYPHTPQHWTDLGQIHFLRGERVEAAQAYRQAIELDPGNSSYRSMLNRVESSQ